VPGIAESRLHRRLRAQVYGQSGFEKARRMGIIVHFRASIGLGDGTPRSLAIWLLDVTALDSERGFRGSTLEQVKSRLLGSGKVANHPVCVHKMHNSA
jgi:hypothetical protein